MLLYTAKKCYEIALSLFIRLFEVKHHFKISFTDYNK